jgi:transcriptional regulator with XRE-family HTH domain
MAADKAAADNIAFGAAMRLEREARGYSPEAFVQRVELETSKVEAIERGEGNVTYLMILRIARGLDMSPVEFVIRAGFECAAEPVTRPRLIAMTTRCASASWLLKKTIALNKRKQPRFIS